MALVVGFIHANLDSPSSRFPGGVYVDMFSIRDSDLGSMGAYHGLSLVPWGMLYKAQVRATNRPQAFVFKEGRRSCRF